MAKDVVFKGIRDGLVVMLPSDLPIGEALELLLGKMEQNRPFFEGGNCPIYIAGEIDDQAMVSIRTLLGEQFGVRIVERANERRQGEAQMGIGEEPSQPAAPGQEPATVNLPRTASSAGKESLLLTITGTVRNGQRITYQGDILVLGDANPGSQLIAGGNVIVMGTLRGLAHAGALGEESASVSAFTLMPTQIRIASFIARPPEGIKRPEVPQMAKVNDGRIEIVNLTVKAMPGGLR